MVNILTSEHIRILKQAQANLVDAIPIVQGLEKCGSNCDLMKDEIETLMARFNAILTEFGGSK